MLGSKVGCCFVDSTPPPPIYYISYIFIFLTFRYRSEENSTIGEVTYLHYYSNDEDVGSMVSVYKYILKCVFSTSNWLASKTQSFFFHDAYEAQPYSDEVTIGDACLGVVPTTISKTGKPLMKETISISSLLQRAQQLKYRDVQQISNPPS